MIYSDLYTERFAASERESRNRIWQVLTSDFFQRFINPADTVLDLGCGYGEFINNILCRKKIAVDIDSSYKKYLDPGIKFVNSTLDNLKLPASSVDKAFISNVFEHLQHEQIIGTVREAARVLKKGGLFLVLQPNIRFIKNDYWMFFDHITPIDDRALEEIFSVFGFKISYKALRFLPYTTKNRLPKHPFFVRLYLAFPPAWRLLGKESFLVFQKQ